MLTRYARNMNIGRYVEKYSAKGLTGDALYNRIIQGTLTPNPIVNTKFGIK
jgi:hypothetical protein